MSDGWPGARADRRRTDRQAQDRQAERRRKSANADAVWGERHSDDDPVQGWRGGRADRGLHAQAATAGSPAAAPRGDRTASRERADVGLESWSKIPAATAGRDPRMVVA